MRGDEPVAGEAFEQEYWVSTHMLVLYLADLACAARGAGRQALAHALIRALLEATCDATELQQADFLCIPDDILDMCTEDADDTLCGCVREWRSGAQRSVAGENPQQKSARLLVDLFTFLECDALSAWLARMLQVVVQCLESRWEEWADTSWFKTPAAAVVNDATGKRRRSDFHAKQYAVCTSLQSGAASSRAAAARSMDGVWKQQASVWREKEMAAFQAESHLRFAGSSSIALAFDAAMLGQPAKELLVGLARNLEKRCDTAFPPQAFVGALCRTGQCPGGLQGAGRASAHNSWSKRSPQGWPPGQRNMGGVPQHVRGTSGGVFSTVKMAIFTVKTPPSKPSQKHGVVGPP